MQDEDRRAIDWALEVTATKELRDRPVDHRVVFMTNNARVLHAGCVPDHVKVPIPVLLQAIRRLERQVERARDNHRPQEPGPLA